MPSTLGVIELIQIRDLAEDLFKVPTGKGHLPNGTTLRCRHECLFQEALPKLGDTGDDERDSVIRVTTAAQPSIPADNYHEPEEAIAILARELDEHGQ